MPDGTGRRSRLDGIKQDLDVFVQKENDVFSFCREQSYFILTKKKTLHVHAPMKNVFLKARIPTGTGTSTANLFLQSSQH